jgi:hypothetical protein
MKYTVEIDPGAMIHVLNSIKTDSVIQMLIGGIHRHRQRGDFINLL